MQCGSRPTSTVTRQRRSSRVAFREEEKGYPVSELALSGIMALNAPMVWRHTGYDVVPYSYVVLPYGRAPDLSDDGEEDRLHLIEGSLEIV
jgi:hypothetical protein